MSVTTFTELKASIASWANRRDSVVTDAIPDWIAFFEARARRELDSWLTGTVSFTNVTADKEISASVDAVQSVAYGDGAAGVYNHPLDLIDFAEYHRRLSCDASVRQPVQAVYADRDEVANTYTLRFYPPVSASAPITNLTVFGMGVLPSLSGSQPTNRLLAVAPDLYVKGSLVEGAEFLKDDDRIPIWAREVDRSIRALNLLQERRRAGGQPRPAPLPVVFG
ncbi:MAG TPA: hypothetical protein VJS69_02470 [Candidatus Krumholzibacteria bacterium]|nr:hypothetical protein [Candidatus Krumholzibacteria bacterium]